MSTPSASKKAKVEASGTLMENTVMEGKRREKISSLYSDLQSMVPNLLTKPSRAFILEGTISYIEELENTVKELEARKKAKFNPHGSLQTLKTSSLNMAVIGGTASFGIQSAKRPGLVSDVVRLFEEHKAEVLGFSIASEEGSREIRIMVTAVINGEGEGEAVAISKIKSNLLKCL